MTATKDQNLSAKTLYYAYLNQLLVDEVDVSLASSIESLKNHPDHENRLAYYRKARGKLQLALAKEHLSEESFEKIRQLSERLADTSESDSEEALDLQLHELQGVRQRRTRQAVIYGIMVMTILLIGKSFFQKKEAHFAPVEALVYETRVLEDQFVDRLDLQTSEITEVREYFLNYPKLLWEDVTLNTPPFWKLIGASVLDYEIVKISLMAFSRSLTGKDILEEEIEVVSSDGTETRIEVLQKKILRKDLLVHYSFDSKKDFLPSFEPTIHKGVEFYTYESEDYNIILWRTRGRYHFIVGRTAPLEMADYIP